MPEMEKCRYIPKAKMGKVGLRRQEWNTKLTLKEIRRVANYTRGYILMPLVSNSATLQLHLLPLLWGNG